MSKKDVFKSLLILIGATGIGIGLRWLGFAEENMMMVYTVAVLMISIETKGYWAGILSSIIATICCNYFFIQPEYNFSVYDYSYSVTIIIVALVTTALTTRIQTQARICAKKEEDTQMLYEISSSFFNLTGKENIIRHAICQLSKGLNETIVYYEVSKGKIMKAPYIQGSEIEKRQIEEQLYIVEWIAKYEEPRGKYMPIKGQAGMMGIIGMMGEQADEEKQRFIQVVLAQLTIALEKEVLVRQQEATQLEIERERLRSNLLRAISHDLRTPLTGISGASHILLNNGEIDEEKKKELLQGIHEETQWLIQLVENLLSMTRIDEGRLKINKNLELVEEIVGEAIRHIRKRGDSHILKVTVPEQYILINVDGKLIEQVIINLIDNAFKYTPKGSVVELEVHEGQSEIVWKVKDNGRGILEEDLPHLFERFYTGIKGSRDSRRCVGLGLSICKSIIEAHGGTITAQNRKEGGAEFSFKLPKNISKELGGIQ